MYNMLNTFAVLALGLLLVPNALGDYQCQKEFHDALLQIANADFDAALPYHGSFHNIRFASDAQALGEILAKDKHYPPKVGAELKTLLSKIGGMFSHHDAGYELAMKNNGYAMVTDAENWNGNQWNHAVKFGVNHEEISICHTLRSYAKIVEAKSACQLTDEQLLLGIVGIFFTKFPHKPEEIEKKMTQFISGKIESNYHTDDAAAIQEPYQWNQEKHDAACAGVWTAKDHFFQTNGALRTLFKDTFLPALQERNKHTKTTPVDNMLATKIQFVNQVCEGADFGHYADSKSCCRQPDVNAEFSWYGGVTKNTGQKASEPVLKDELLKFWQGQEGFFGFLSDTKPAKQINPVEWENTLGMVKGINKCFQDKKMSTLKETEFLDTYKKCMETVCNCCPMEVNPKLNAFWSKPAAAPFVTFKQRFQPCTGQKSQSFGPEESKTSGKNVRFLQRILSP